MFDRLSFRGATARLLYGYRPAAELAAWSLVKDIDPQKTRSVHGRQGDPAPVVPWVLRARIKRADAFLCRQTKGLYFQDPNQKGLTWPVRTVLIADGQLRATLEPPE